MANQEDNYDTFDPKFNPYQEEMKIDEEILKMMIEPWSDVYRLMEQDNIYSNFFHGNMNLEPQTGTYKTDEYEKPLYTLLESKRVKGEFIGSGAISDFKISPMKVVTEEFATPSEGAQMLTSITSEMKRTSEILYIKNFHLGCISKIEIKKTENESIHDHIDFPFNANYAKENASTQNSIDSEEESELHIFEDSEDSTRMLENSSPHSFNNRAHDFKLEAHTSGIPINENNVQSETSEETSFASDDPQNRENSIQDSIGIMRKSKSKIQKFENTPISQSEKEKQETNNLINAYCPMCKTKNECNDFHSKCYKCKEPIRFRCSTCGKEYSTSSNTRKHINRYHLNRPMKKCVCTICGKYFSHDENLYKHLQRGCGKEAQQKCEHCKYKAKLPADLVRHMLKWHRDNVPGGENHVCKICGKVFLLTKNLKKHNIKCKMVAVVLAPAPNANNTVFSYKIEASS